MTLSCKSRTSPLNNPAIRKVSPLPSSTVKKDPNRTKTHTFPFPAQANQVFNCNKAEIERNFVMSNHTQMALMPINLPSEDEMLAMKIAMRLSGYEKDVI